MLHLDGNGGLQDATYLNDVAGVSSLIALAVAPDQSVLVGAQFLSRVRFGDPDATPPACMTLNVTNSATLLPALITPGEFIIFFGSGVGQNDEMSAPNGAQDAPLSLGDVQVMMDQQPIPVLYAQSNQVNAQIPLELARKSLVTLALFYKGIARGSFQGGLFFASPGLLRLDANVSPLAYAVNEDVLRILRLGDRWWRCGETASGRPTLAA